MRIKYSKEVMKVLKGAFFRLNNGESEMSQVELYAIVVTEFQYNWLNLMFLFSVTEKGAHSLALTTGGTTELKKIN